MGSHGISRRPSSRPRRPDLPGRPGTQRPGAQLQAQQIADDIRRLVRALRDSSAQAQRESGVSFAQLFVLRELAAAGALSVGQLAARTLTHQSSVSAVAQKLFASGYVIRRPGEDARRVELSLTPRGRRLLEKSPSPLQRALFDAIARLPRRMRAALARSLSALVAHLGLSGAPAEMFFEEKSRHA